MTNKENKLKIRSILGIGVLFVTSSSFIIVRANQNPYPMAFVRVFLTAIIAYFILNSHSKSDLSLNITDFRNIIIAGVGLATHFGWWFESLDYIPIGISLSLTNTAPVWLAILGFSILGIKLKRNQYTSIILVIIGSVLLFAGSGSQSNNSRGLLLALGSSIGFAFYLLAARQTLSKIGLWRYFGLVNFVSALSLLSWIIISGDFGGLFIGELWIWGLMLAIFPGILGHAVYNWAMSKLDPVDVGVATLGEPVLGTIIAWIYLSQALNNLQISAYISLLFAILLTIEFDKEEESD